MLSRTPTHPTPAQPPTPRTKRRIEQKEGECLARSWSGVTDISVRRADGAHSFPNVLYRNRSRVCSASFLQPASGSIGAITLNVLSSSYFLGVSLFLFIVAFPPLEDATSVNLSVHMFQHVLIVVAGALVGYSLYKKRKSRNLGCRQDQRLGAVGMAVVLLLVVYWHLPQNWDAAVLNPVTHALEHISFLGVGIIIGLLVPMLPSVGMVRVMFLDYIAHTYYAFILATTKVPVYSLYSVDQQSTLSVFILGLSNGLLAVCILALVYLHFSWKARAIEAAPAAPPPASFSTSAHAELNQEPSSPRHIGRKRRNANVVASLVMIITLVTYFGAVGVLLGAASGQPRPQASTVYLNELPVSWQFSPQSIRVVIGVNNTVTWVSRSISFDTVTGTNDSSLASGPIAPAQQFTFTFSEPGTYPYYCIYHPWMRGSVIVFGA